MHTFNKIFEIDFHECTLLRKFLISSLGGTGGPKLPILGNDHFFLAQVEEFFNFIKTNFGTIVGDESNITPCYWELFHIDMHYIPLQNKYVNGI